MPSSGSGYCGIEALEGVAQDLGDGEVAHPLAVGRHDVPRRVSVDVSRSASRYAAMYVGPQRPVVEVAAAELPPLVGAVDAILQARPLLLLRDVQEQLDDRRALVDRASARSRGCGRSARRHALRRHELLDPHDEHVLVVAAVEHPDLPRARAAPWWIRHR